MIYRTRSGVLGLARVPSTGTDSSPISHPVCSPQSGRLESNRHDQLTVVDRG